tara:strand:+ start:162 stop:269 length:108 start_codon:yes stop_codon:yes gene_type:complete
MKTFIYQISTKVTITTVATVATAARTTKPRQGQSI